MRSIRGHLLVWFLPGFAILWAVAGGTVYYAVWKRHERQLDTTLRDLRDALPLGLAGSEGGEGGVSFEDLAPADLGLYFQIRSSEGAAILKSENLGRYELPFLPDAGAEAIYRYRVLGNGDPVRVLAIRTEEGALGPLHLTVAVTREEMISSLRETGILILLLGVVSGGLFVLLLAAALRSGLAPLTEVGSFAAGVDPGQLSGRIPCEHLPQELRPIAGSLNTLMDRLETAFAREKRFGADLAHEFRTPLSAIRTTAEVALQFPAEDREEALRDIVAVSETLQATIENLLTLTRIAGGTVPLRCEHTCMDDAFARAWKPFEERARQRGLTLSRESTGSPGLDTDPELLRLILVNLLGNAVDYAPENGIILVTTGGSTLFSVSNAAPHLSEADLPHLFERLWRHDAARTDSTHCGLGLSLARTCADALSLDLAADLREGSIRFTLTPGETR